MLTGYAQSSPGTSTDQWSNPVEAAAGSAPVQPGPGAEAPAPPQAPLEATSTPDAVDDSEFTPEEEAVDEAAATATPRPPAPASSPLAPLPAAATTATPRPAPTATPAPPAPTATPAPPAPPAAPVALNGMEQEMLAAHNVERARVGLTSLQVDGALVSIARQRAQDMASRNYFSHTSPTGHTAFTLLGAAGYRLASGGENIARNNYPNGETVSVAMTGFMNSPGHRQNILEGQFSAVGIGSALGADGMKYFAVVFAGF